jgi:hypothetical protein
MSKQATPSERQTESSGPAAPAPVGITAIVDQIDGPAPSSAETIGSEPEDHVEPARTKLARSPRRVKPAPGETRKADIILKKLHSARGATIETLVEASGWQPHSIRGFISGTVKKRMGLTVVSEPGKNGVRRYRIVAAPTAKEVADAGK